jgi:hypothetical protein
MGEFWQENIMDISALSSMTSISASSASAGTEVSLQLPTSHQWQADQNDALAFSQAVNGQQAREGVAGASTASETSLADDVINKMQSLSASAQEKGEALERLIVKATDTLNPADVIAANRMMSEYYLENLMTAKLIGNATKAIERLTSLQ